MKCFILYVDPLSIEVTPINLIVGKGDTAKFTATAKGINKNNFRYQWRKESDDSLPKKVSGDIGAVLTIPNAVGSDGGKYHCIVTNEWNRSMMSNDGTLVIEGKYSTKF